MLKFVWRFGVHFSVFLLPLTQVELSNGNWQEIERIELNKENDLVENKEDEIKKDDSLEPKDTSDITNGSANGNLNGTANTSNESKDITSDLESSKVWVFAITNSLNLFSNNQNIKSTYLFSHGWFTDVAFREVTSPTPEPSNHKAI